MVEIGAPAARRWYRTPLPACLALFAVALVHNEAWHPDTVAFGQLFVWMAVQPYNPYAQTDATAARATAGAIFTNKRGSNGLGMMYSGPKARSCVPP